LLRVTWTNEQGDNRGTRQKQVVRVGRLVNLDARFDTLDDLKWTMEFDWMSRGQQAAQAGATQDGLLSASRAAIVVQNDVVGSVVLAKLRSDNQRDAASASTFTLGQLEQLADGPRALVDSFARAADSIANRVGKLGDLIVKVRDVPSSVLGRVLDTAT